MFVLNRSGFTLAAALLAGFLAGCGDSGPVTYPVTGTVTLDGQPIKEGEIAFRDTEGTVPSAGGPITDGEFSFESQPASMRVEITARREIPGKFDSPAPGIKVPVTKQFIPPRYNMESELTKEVVADDNEFHFELTSAAPK